MKCSNSNNHIPPQRKGTYSHQKFWGSRIGRYVYVMRCWIGQKCQVEMHAPLDQKVRPP